VLSPVLVLRPTGSPLDSPALVLVPGPLVVGPPVVGEPGQDEPSSAEVVDPPGMP